MLPYFSEEYGNPSSTHEYGQRAETAVEHARAGIADHLGCRAEQIIFTSGGSESDNLALRGIALSSLRTHGKNHILTTAVEHMAVAATVNQLAERFGFEVEFLPVSKTGRVSAEEVAARIRDETAIVSVIYANNEIGTTNPIAEIGAVCRENIIPFHSDALQAPLCLDLDVDRLSVDLLSIGAHKFYGPKGVGALFIRDRSVIEPLQTGGEQEFGLRGGTLNVPLIVGMAAALDIARDERREFTRRMAALRDRLVHSVLELVPDARLTGEPVERLPYHASFVFKHVDGNLLLNLLDSAGFACSSGSACKTGSPAPSEVLLSIGISPAWALGSLRITLGRGTTEQDIERFCDLLPETISKARKLTA